MLRNTQDGSGGSPCRERIALRLKPSSVRFEPDVNAVRLKFNGGQKRSTDTAISNNSLVKKLADSALFREFRRAFEDATRLPLTLRAVESWQLAHAGSRYQNGFCDLMSRSNNSCSACLQMQQRVCEGVSGMPCTMSCVFGLSETAVGVKVGHDLIAYLQTGQVFFNPPTPRQTQRAVKQIKEWELKLNVGEVIRRYNKTPVVHRREYNATVRLLQFFADQLGPLASQIVLRQQTAEPAQITRARKFIQDHHQEKLSLGAVAWQAGMSTFYFCKMFKRVTGMNFTHYVSRIRGEKAMTLLLNLNYRISEIAFEVGFQSLTHFNRVFRIIAGESPTEFRRHLPGARSQAPLPTQLVA